MEQFNLLVKIKCPHFQSGKEKRRYTKSLIMEIDKKFNQHTLDIGDWPLIIQVIEEQPVSNLLVLYFAKALESDENAIHTMNKIIAYMKVDMHLKIDEIMRSC